jgi:Family of unknown function (DUF6206)
MIDAVDLAQLEAEVQRAFASGDRSRLRVLGYGEISLVLGWPTGEPRWACKRLPAFPSVQRADAYTDLLGDYLDVLRGRRIDVLATEVQQLAADGGSVVLYCIQPLLPNAVMATEIVRSHPDRAAEVLAGIVDAAFRATDDRVGFDAQLANWAVRDRELVYFDVTTPLLRAPDGSDALDTRLFMASFPWPLRAPIRRFVLPGIIERYHQPRSVVLDLAANLVKERLDEHIPLVLAAANPRLLRPLDEAEVRADYRSDARTWQLLQALRRADRTWQRRARQRLYPFLLPDHIQR